MEKLSGKYLLRTTLLLLLLLLLLLTFTTTTMCSVTGDAINYGSKRVVRVQNDLGPTVTLKVHCRSKDKDLGAHDINNGEYTEWSFQISWIKVDRFWCIIQWNGGKEYSFDAFTSQRDLLRCSDKCWWSIKPDGAYSYNQYLKKYEKLYSWS